MWLAAFSYVGEFLLKAKSGQRIAVYAIVIWMIINIALFAAMIVSGDEEDANNWIEVALWVISTLGLLSMKKTKRKQLTCISRLFRLQLQKGILRQGGC